MMSPRSLPPTAPCRSRAAPAPRLSPPPPVSRASYQASPPTPVAVDPDSDGAGVDSDVLYVTSALVVQQFGPANPPGLSSPPGADDERHNTNRIANLLGGLAVEPSIGRLYLSSGFNTPGVGPGVFVLDETSPTPPTATVDSCTGVTDHSLTCQASIDPNGPPATRYHFEYSTDGSAWTSTPETLLGAQDDPQAVEETISPGTFGLDPNTAYHVRVSAGRKFADPVISNELIKTTAARAPLAETAGAPIRTTKMAQLNGRVTPFGSAANYHFEYGTQGPCGANPCASTSTQSAGSGQGMKLVAAQINGLSPDTTYHYRLVVDNGVGGAVAGSDMTATTRSTSDPLDGPAPHGAYPGPPHSDRAYELVSLPDAGGNPALLSFGLSNDGNRTLYNVAGGTPISGSGNITAFYASARPAGEHPSSDWQSSVITPGRELLIGSVWSDSTNSGDLSVTVAVNGNGSGDGQRVLWRLSPFGAPVKIFETSSTKITHPVSAF